LPARQRACAAGDLFSEQTSQRSDWRIARGK
jgi:hypothetical protein